MNDINSLLEKMALDMERAENIKIYFQGTTKFSTPLMVNSIRIQIFPLKRNNRVNTLQ